MSLHFVLRVNDQAIGALTIQRHPDQLDPGPDTVCTYTVERHDSDGLRSCQVRHRYGDGAWALVQTAFEEVGERAGETT